MYSNFVTKLLYRGGELQHVEEDLNIAQQVCQVGGTWNMSNLPNLPVHFSAIPTFSNIIEEGEPMYRYAGRLFFN